VEFRRGCVAASAGEAVGGGTDALEESVGAIQRQRAVQQGLEDTVERAQDGVAIGERAETDGGGVGPHQSAVAAPVTHFESLVGVAESPPSEGDRSAGSFIGLVGGAEPGFHSILLCGGVPPPHFSCFVKYLES